MQNFSIKFGVIRTPRWRFFSFFFFLELLSTNFFPLTYYQRGHRHLRFTLSSDVVDKSDADLIARHFHLFILFSIFRNGIH